MQGALSFWIEPTPATKAALGQKLENLWRAEIFNPLHINYFTEKDGFIIPHKGRRVPVK